MLKEIGIDLSHHTSKHMHEFLDRKITTVITVCGNADQACPMYPGQVNRHHWGFDDSAHATGTEEEVLAAFRRVRDEIRLVRRRTEGRPGPVAVPVARGWSTASPTHALQPAPFFLSLPFLPRSCRVGQ